LFAEVELVSRREATGLEILGLDVEPDDGDAKAGLLLQPCRALVGRRCGIYPLRPACCRSFECRLLQDVRDGAVSVERAREHVMDALARIRRVRALLVELGQRDQHLPLAERCADTLAREGAATPAVRRKQAQLELAMSGLSKLLRRTFLRPNRSGA